MYRWEILHAVTRQRVFGIVRTATADDAERTAGTMIESGIDAVEITLTTPRSLETVARLAESRSRAVIGAGTVLDAAAARAAVEAGARFLVSPSLDPGVIRTGHRYGVPVIPGVATPTEMVRALEEGADALKLFPASGVGPGWLADVRAALPQAPIIPTGGVTLDDAPDWIAAGAVACGLGSALARGGATGDQVTTLLERLAAAR